MALFRILGVTVTIALGSLPIAQGPSEQPPPTYQIALVTFEPGLAIYELFGHNGLWVRGPEDTIGVLYDYGRFSFTDPGFLWRFYKGDMQYWMAGQRADREFARYLAAGRTIRVQELRLPADKALALAAFLAANVQPENRFYQYKYFTDNCSTRIRDALARVALPSLNTLKDVPAKGESYRSVTRHYTSVAPLWAIVIELALGSNADQEISKWDEAFIPERLSLSLRYLEEGRGRTESQTAVASEYVLQPAAYQLSHSSRFDVGWVGLVTGSITGLLIIVSSRASNRRFGSVPARLWLITTGTGGVLLLTLWLLTKHTFAASNSNLLLLNPLALFAGLSAPSSNPRSVTWAMQLLAGSVLLAFILRLPPHAQGTALGVVLGVGFANLASLFALQYRAVPKPTRN